MACGVAKHNFLNITLRNIIKMPGKHVPPTIEETAFSCPHCGAYTTQYWFNVFSNRVDAGKTPHIVTEAMVENFKNDKNLDKETRDRLLPRFRKLASGAK